MTESLYRQYKQIENQNPESLVFSVKNGEYTCFDKTAEEIIVLSDMSLMNLLVYWCNGDKEQMLRIFATSGLFRPNKSADYYEITAIKAIRDLPARPTYTPTPPKSSGGNGKR